MSSYFPGDRAIAPAMNIARMCVLILFVALAMAFLVTNYNQGNHLYRNLGENWFLRVSEPRQYRRNVVYLNTGADPVMEVAYLAGLSFAHSRAWLRPPRRSGSL